MYDPCYLAGNEFPLLITCLVLAIAFFAASVSNVRQYRRAEHFREAWVDARSDLREARAHVLHERPVLRIVDGTPFDGPSAA